MNTITDFLDPEDSDIIISDIIVEGQSKTRSIDNYIRQLFKKYRQRDRKYQDKLFYEQQRPISFPPSGEVYLLQKYKWLILANQSNIRYRSDLQTDWQTLKNFDYLKYRLSASLSVIRTLSPVLNIGYFILDNNKLLILSILLHHNHIIAILVMMVIIL